MLLYTEDMNSLEKATLENCRECLLEDLDPTMSFLSQLYCARVITEDQKDRIQNQTTRQDKVIVLLDILPRRGPRAFRQFIEVLETDYHWIKVKLNDELQAQEYQKKILDAIDDRMKRNGDFIRDKDYINKIVRETILPFLLQELRTSPSGSPSNKTDQSLKDIIISHLLPLLGVSGVKNKLEMQQEALHEKILEIVEELRDKCANALGIPCESCQEEPIPLTIDKRMNELKLEIAMLRKENKKSKKAEEKFTAESQKLKTENNNLKAEVKKMKADLLGSKNELKKLKDEAQKYKTENTKLKQEVKILKDALNDAGVDLRISSDFCGN